MSRVITNGVLILEGKGGKEQWFWIKNIKDVLKLPLSKAIGTEFIISKPKVMEFTITDVVYGERLLTITARK